MKRGHVGLFVLFGSILFQQTSWAQGGCADQLGSTSTTSDVFRCLVEMQREIESVRDMLSTNLVVAFNGTEAEPCPPGWKQFALGNGRVIIGAGEASGLTYRKPGQPGGSEIINLPDMTFDWAWARSGTSTDNLPVLVPHQNESGITISSNLIYGSRLPEPYEFSIAGSADSIEDSNLPPYVALYWCSPE